MNIDVSLPLFFKAAKQRKSRGSGFFELKKVSTFVLK